MKGSSLPNINGFFLQFLKMFTPLSRTKTFFLRLSYLKINSEILPSGNFILRKRLSLQQAVEACRIVRC
jgi:hypothetical protein